MFDEDEEFDEYNEHLLLEGKTVSSVEKDFSCYGNNSLEIKFTDGSWISFSHGGNDTPPIIYIANKSRTRKRRRL